VNKRNLEFLPCAKYPDSDKYTSIGQRGGIEKERDIPETSGGGASEAS
jgi:hypothetical protein